jgi:fido (protein-threonine AMPylation protein)
LKEPYQKPAISPDGTPTQKWVHIGQYKTDPNHVLTITNEIFRFASPEQTPALMNDLIDWYRAAKVEPTHEPLLLAAEFHYRFIRIHPFDDGNGRTARILMNFVLMQAGYPPVIIKTEDKQNYFAALRQADAGLLVPFVEYVGQNLVRSLELILKGARGQSIEDPDDIDKEIALLEQKLKMTGERVEKRWSNDTFAELAKDVIKPLFEAFMIGAKKLNKFYGEINLFFEHNGTLHEIVENNSLDDYLLALGLELYLSEKQQILKSMSCVVMFSKFNLKHKDHSSMLIIEIHFHDDYYNIVCRQQQIEKMYHQTLSDNEIKNIIDSETKKQMETIKEKMAKSA